MLKPDTQGSGLLRETNFDDSEALKKPNNANELKAASNF